MGCVASSVTRSSSAANTVKVITKHETKRGLRVITCSTQGWRAAQEDVVAVEEVTGGLAVGVFDGHGGPDVALFSSKNLWKKVCSQTWVDGDYSSALKTGFLALDLDLRQNAVRGGSTATVAVVMDRDIYVANVGDSRTILCSGTSATALSVDHKPTGKEEIERIHKAGGCILHGAGGGCSRVLAPDSNLALATTRALGDFSFKNGTGSQTEQVVTANPDVLRHVRTAGDSFLVLGSDGVWDSLLNSDVAESLIAAAPQDEAGASVDKLEAIVSELVDVCLRRGSMDNVSMVVVDLRSTPGADGAKNGEVKQEQSPGKGTSGTHTRGAVPGSSGKNISTANNSSTSISSSNGLTKEEVMEEEEEEGTHLLACRVNNSKAGKMEVDSNDDGDGNGGDVGGVSAGGVQLSMPSSGTEAGPHEGIRQKGEG